MKKCISIDDAGEGMILTKPVTNDKGMVLCSKGTSLTESLIQRFKQKSCITRQSLMLPTFYPEDRHSVCPHVSQRINLHVNAS